MTELAPQRDLADGDLHGVLVEFYATIAGDPLLAPYFAEVDMAEHMPRIVAFWSTMIFRTAQYSGNAFRPHAQMPGLTADHFSRWMAVLEATVDARFAGPRAEDMKQFGHRVAYSMQIRLGIQPFAGFTVDGVPPLRSATHPNVR
jgi:hemoglobin